VGRSLHRGWDVRIWLAPPRRKVGDSRNDKGKHLCVNSIIDVSGDTASVSSDFLKVNPIADGSGATGYGIGTMGRYEDHFVRQGGEWKIAKRKVHIMSPGDGA